MAASSIEGEVFMKVGLKVMWLAAGFGLAISLSARAQDSPEAAAQKIISQAREALGGDAKFKSVQSLSYNGKSRRMVRRMMMGPGGENAAPPAPTLQENDFEVDVLTPDKYVRRDTRELNFNNNIATLISHVGFSGDTPIQRTEAIGDLPFNPNQMQFGGGGPDAAAQLRAAKQGFVRAWLGFAFELPAAYGLTYRSVGPETVNNTAYDVVEASGPDNFSTKLYFDAGSHRLAMIRYKAQVPQGGPQFVRMGGPPPGGQQPGGAPPTGTPPPGEGQQRVFQRPAGPMQDVEVEVTFSDYKAVDGIQLPHKIRRSTNGEMNEETEVKKFKINSNPKADKFKTSE